MAGGHELNWLEAIQGKQKISSPFEFAAKLTEVMLLGIVSLRAGAKIHYDAANMRDHEQAAGERVRTTTTSSPANTGQAGTCAH